MCRPVVDKQLVVDPQPHAVVRMDCEGVSFRELWLDIPRPFDSITVIRDEGIRTISPPVIVHQMVDTCRPQVAKVSSIVVFAAQATWRSPVAGHWKIIRRIGEVKIIISRSSA